MLYLTIAAVVLVFAAAVASHPRHRQDRPLVLAFLALAILAVAVALIAVRVWPPPRG